MAERVAVELEPAEPRVLVQPVGEHRRAAVANAIRREAERGESAVLLERRADFLGADVADCVVPGREGAGGGGRGAGERGAGGEEEKEEEEEEEEGGRRRRKNDEEYEEQEEEERASNFIFKTRTSIL